VARDAGTGVGRRTPAGRGRRSGPEEGGMKDRWRSLVQPDAEHPHPDPGEAFGVWMLGLLWAMTCMWLGYFGNHWVLPGMLLAGLLALWGWRHPEWLWWFPTVLVVATVLEPLLPLPLR